MVTKQQLSRGRMADGKPNPIDIHIGRRLRLRRMYLGIAQKDLAILAGISYQQIQQYEIGGNRLSAQRLWIFSRLLDIPVSFFFEDMSPDTIEQVFSYLPENKSINLQTGKCPIEERTDVQKLVCAYMRLLRSKKHGLAESFVNLLDEISHSPVHEENPAFINNRNTKKYKKERPL